MAAETVSHAARRASAFRALILSAVCPGLGQLLCGRTSEAFAVVLIRAVALVIPAVWVYASRAGAVVPAAGGLAVFIGVHCLSCFDSWRRGRRAPVRAASRRWLFLFACLSYALSVLPLFVFFQFFPVKKLNDAMLYPSFYKGDCLFCSARAASAIMPGDLVFYSLNGTGVSGRVAAVNDGDTVECVGGRLSVNGDILEQAPAGESEKAGNEFFYREKGAAGWYAVYRRPAAKTGSDKPRITVEKGYFAVVPDNRMDGEPVLVPQRSVVCRIESVISLSWNRVLPVREAQ